MYSGTTLTKMSGRVVGAHQKIDRVARKHLALLCESQEKFPPIRTILHFEGKKGPDAIKRKSPAKDEPWHYFDPFDDNDQQILAIVQEHYDNLVKELKLGNDERAAFEASWLAHAIVDGLTPAHHFPYEEKLAEIRGGEGNETRTSVKEKLVLPGVTISDKVKNNWKMWGPRGLMTAHGLFEWGVATIIAPQSFSKSVPSQSDMKRIRKIGIIEEFKSAAREIAAMDLFDRYYKKGWTTQLSLEVKQRLAPLIIQTVTLTWYNAVQDAKNSAKLEK